MGNGVRVGSQVLLDRRGTSWNKRGCGLSSSLNLRNLERNLMTFTKLAIKWALDLIDHLDTWSFFRLDLAFFVAALVFFDAIRSILGSKKLTILPLPHLAHAIEVEVSGSNGAIRLLGHVPRRNLERKVLTVAEMTVQKNTYIWVVVWTILKLNIWANYSLRNCLVRHLLWETCLISHDLRVVIFITWSTALGVLVDLRFFNVNDVMFLGVLTGFTKLGLSTLGLVYILLLDNASRSLISEGFPKLPSERPARRNFTDEARASACTEEHLKNILWCSARIGIPLVDCQLGSSLSWNKHLCLSLVVSNQSRAILSKALTSTPQNSMLWVSAHFSIFLR